MEGRGNRSINGPLMRKQQGNLLLMMKHVVDGSHPSTCHDQGGHGHLPPLRAPPTSLPKQHVGHVARGPPLMRLLYRFKMGSPCFGQGITVSPHETVDLVTVAQAFHWFDRPTFYQQVRWLLKRPNGVIAVRCGTLHRVNDSIDAVLDRVYAEAAPFWAPPRKMVDDEYRSFEFPFEPVEGTEHTGPFEFEGKQSMDLDKYLAYIRSWSAYQTARQKGFELLTEEVVEDFKRAWGGEDEKHNIKVAKFPIFLRIGKVGK